MSRSDTPIHSGMCAASSRHRRSSDLVRNENLRGSAPRRRRKSLPAWPVRPMRDESTASSGSRTPISRIDYDSFRTHANYSDEPMPRW
jgi:hypothetical protein